MTCDGVTLNANDIVAADSDGVVVVPRARAQERLTLAQQMDFKERSMYAVIEQMKSIVEAVKKFGRLWTMTLDDEADCTESTFIR